MKLSPLCLLLVSLLGTILVVQADDEPGHRVTLGSFTYTPLPQRAEFRPTFRALLILLLICGGFTLV